MRAFLVRAVGPALLTVCLFVIALFLVVIPTLERSILEQKRELIRELTNAAWNIPARFEAEERAGRLSRAAAQRAAIDQLRTLHYGQELKDYFWVNDTRPVMIVHPYRTDLEGQDLSTFADPSGKRLFVEFVRVTAEHGAGFVDYQWQWKDNPQRIEPKISYVKLFQPWGWIIGTGVYINDVHDEIAAVRRQLVAISFAILAVIAGLLAWLLFDHYRSEQQRRRAEAALRESEEKYRLLVESAEGSFLLALAGAPLYANRSMQRMLGYGESELAGLRLDEIIVPTGEEKRRGRTRLEALRQGQPAPATAEALLRRQDGRLLPVILSLSEVRLGDRQGLIAVATDLTAQREKMVSQEQVIADLQLALGFLNRRAEDVCTPLPAAVAGETIGELLARLAAADCEALPLTLADGKLRLATAAELGLALARGFAADDPAVSVELPLPVIIPAVMPLFEAYPLLARNRFRPLLVTAPDGSAQGMLGTRELMQLPQYAPTLLLGAIEQAATPEVMIRESRRLPELVGVLMDGGVKLRHVNRLITSVADALTARAIQFAVDQLGPPPAPFVFMVLGSEGRHEQTLRTDQDNAIVFAEVPAAEEETVRAYFLKLGELVCGWNDRAGYAGCKGDVMARNPQWCGSLTHWRNAFRDWVNTLDPRDLMQTKICFDFRGAVGDQELIRTLRADAAVMLKQSSRFFTLLARNLLELEPPVGWFGNLLVRDAGDGRATFDIKLAMIPIVDFARIYALKHGIAATNTLERLDALRELQVLTPASHEEITDAFRHLMRLRLEHQLRAVRAGRTADNLIAPAELTAIDRKMLAEAFTQIKYFQTRLSQDFTGMMYHS